MENYNPNAVNTPSQPVEEKKSKIWLWIILIAAFFFILLIVLISLIFYISTSSIKSFMSCIVTGTTL